MFRRSSFFASVASLVGWLAMPSADAQVVRIESITYVVRDARRSATFYERALSFRRLGETTSSAPDVAALMNVPGLRTRTVALALGDQRIALVQYLRPRGGRPIPADSRSEDRWFQHFAIVVSDMPSAYAQLRRSRFVAITRGGPQRLPANTGGVTAFKFRDPDGHPLELLYLPEGVGRATWHDPSRSGFLGIDHTAVGVASTADSLHFYRDLLGFHVSGSSLNQGPEQANLDDADHATVRITGLRPPDDAGPGIEFLDYREPADGRAQPAGSRPFDLWDTEIRLSVVGLDALAERLRAAGVAGADSHVHAVAGQPFSRALRVRDPDGHALLLTEP